MYSYVSKLNYMSLAGLEMLEMPFLVHETQVKTSFDARSHRTTFTGDACKTRDIVGLFLDPFTVSALCSRRGTMR